MLVFFYAFLWLMIFYNIVMALYLRRKLKSLTMLNVNNFYEKIKYFPIMLAIWWLSPSIHRILQMLDQNSFFVDAMHIAFKSSYGLANMLLYAFNPNVKTIILKKLRILDKDRASTNIDSTLLV